MATNQELYSDLPLPPGEYLEEVIENLGITKHELAKRMNRPAPKLSASFKGHKATRRIPPVSWRRLSGCLPTSGRVWRPNIDLPWPAVISKKNRIA